MVRGDNEKNGRNVVTMKKWNKYADDDEMKLIG